MSRQERSQAELTSNPEDKEPHKKKQQTAINKGTEEKKSPKFTTIKEVKKDRLATAIEDALDLWVRGKLHQKKKTS